MRPGAENPQSLPQTHQKYSSEQIARFAHTSYICLCWGSLPICDPGRHKGYKLAVGNDTTNDTNSHLPSENGAKPRLSTSLVPLKMFGLGRKVCFLTDVTVPESPKASSKNLSSSSKGKSNTCTRVTGGPPPKIEHHKPKRCFPENDLATRKCSGEAKVTRTTSYAIWRALTSRPAKIRRTSVKISSLVLSASLRSTCKLIVFLERMITRAKSEKAKGEK